MELIESPTLLWTVAVAAIVAVLLTCLRPLFKWAINTEAYLQIVLELVQAGDVDRAVKLSQVAPSGRVPRLVIELFNEGRGAAEALHRQFEKEHSGHRIKLAAAGCVVVPAIGLCVLTVLDGAPFWPLVISSALSALLLWLGWRSVNEAERGCRRVLSTWFDELARTTPPEVRGRIKALQEL
jgi:membrane protein implicated in regulation of membrane protease activity